MDLYRQLLGERKALTDEQQAIFTAAEAAGGYTDEQRVRDDEITAALGVNGADIRRIEQRRASELAAPAVAEAAFPAPDPDDQKAPTPFAGNTPLGDELLAVMSAAKHPGSSVDPRLTAIMAAAQGLNERVDSEGGFLVQHDVTDEILRDTYETGLLVTRTRRRPVTGSGFKAKAVDETSRADGQRMGGIQAFWTGEADTMTATKPKFRIIDLDLDKLTGVYYATDELLQDAASLEAEVRGWFVEEFGFKFDDGIIRGTGAGMPLGILNSPALVTQAAEGGQTADTVNALNIQKMWARMPARSLGRASWIINQAVWPQLFAMNQANMPIFLQGGNLASAPFGTLLGRPILPAEQASAIGDVGDVIFADLSQYLWIEKGGVQAASSIHVQFLTGETAFRFVVRVNGAPIPAAAVTPFKGADTLSPFVTLAAR